MHQRADGLRTARGTSDAVLNSADDVRVPHVHRVRLLPPSHRLRWGSRGGLGAGEMHQVATQRGLGLLDKLQEVTAVLAAGGVELDELGGVGSVGSDGGRAGQVQREFEVPASMVNQRRDFVQQRQDSLDLLPDLRDTRHDRRSFR